MNNFLTSRILDNNIIAMKVTVNSFREVLLHYGKRLVINNKQVIDSRETREIITLEVRYYKKVYLVSVATDFDPFGSVRSL